MVTLFDIPKVETFLKGKNEGTRNIYRAGLLTFQEFYKPQGTIADFIDRLEKDRNLGWRDSHDVATEVIGDYVDWLQKELTDEKGKVLRKAYTRKTVRVYVAAIQQLAKKLKVPFATNDVHLPASNPLLKKYSWTVPEVVRFFDLFEIQLYRSLGVLIFQSFIDCSTARALTYGDIKAEYEAKTYPLCLDTERVKSDIPFMSFIGKWGIKELHKWLDSIPKETLTPDTALFPVTKVAVCDYFRKKAKLFLGDDFKDSERNKCGTHSLRAGGSTLTRDNLKGNAEMLHASDRYIDFFMGKTVEEQKRVYSSKSKEGWRETWRTTVEPYVTPKTF